MPVSDFKSNRKKAVEPKVETPPPPVPVKTPYLHVRVEDEQMDRIKRLALDERCTLKQLVLRGLDSIFESRGLPPL